MELAALLAAAHVLAATQLLSTLTGFMFRYRGAAYRALR